MDNVAPIGITQSIKDLDHLTGYQIFIRLPEGFQGLA